MRTETPQFLFFVSTIRSLKRDILLPTWECYLISTWTYTNAATHALRHFNSALRKVKEFGIEKRISDRPHAMSWLFKINICVVSWQVCQSDLVYAISEAWQWFQQSFAGRTHGAFKESFGNYIYFCKLVCASRMRAGTLAILLVQVSCQILEQDG